MAAIRRVPKKKNPQSKKERLPILLEGLVSQRHIQGFVVQLEMVYRDGNLNRDVLKKLKVAINASNLSQTQKAARLKAIYDWESRGYI